MAKNENFKDRSIVFIGENTILDVLASSNIQGNPMNEDFFRKEMRFYSKSMLLAYIQSIYSKNTALAWYMHSEYNMTYSGIARQLGLNVKTVRTSIENTNNKINEMKMIDVLSIMEDCYDMHIKEKEFKEDDNELSDTDFLISVMKEQMKTLNLTKDEKNEIQKKIDELS
ncbi:MAG: hypothetical protein ACRDDY_04005 [Clostridium sp.]|uniref:hypothetical protein n=1 Tax=Clostridium sp. TaxID=1506 RepID=UPI003EE6271A